MLSTAEANKLVKSALSLLKLAVGYQLSKSVLGVLAHIVEGNTGVVLQSGGAKKYKMKGGSKSIEAKAIEMAALKLLKVALTYEISASLIEEMMKLLTKNGYEKKDEKK